jgi:RNA polymerase sigma-32 factor
MRDAARQPMLDREEEQSLARRSGAGDHDAAHRLLASHLRIVIKIARSYRRSGLPMADLIQEGTLGLMHAIRRFDPDKGIRLSTYAMWWIRASMQDYAVRSWSLVRIGTTNAQKALFLRLRRLTADLKEGAEGLSDDIIAGLAKRFDTTAAEVRALARRVRGGDASLDQRMGSESGERRSWLDLLASDAPSPEELAAEASERQFLAEVVQKALRMLPPREQIIIRMRYLDEVKQTFEAIGHEIGLSKDRVRQLEAQALKVLKERLQPAIAAARG